MPSSEELIKREMSELMESKINDCIDQLNAMKGNKVITCIKPDGKLFIQVNEGNGNTEFDRALEIAKFLIRETFTI